MKTTDQAINIEKTLHIGCVDFGYSRAQLFCKAKVQDGKLSITGVEGPMSNGNAEGGCGQIDMGYAHRDSKHNDKRTTKLIQPEQITFAPGWNRELWLDFLDIWHTWHLNDMQPNCEHQIGEEWNTGRELTLSHFRLSKAVYDNVRDAEKRAMACIAAGQTFIPTAEETRLAKLPDRITLPDKPTSWPVEYVPNGPQYNGDTYNKAFETKLAGWTRPEEHPLGLLCKPCEVCGYKYGSEWRKRELPESVIEFLMELPDADQQPAWV